MLYSHDYNKVSPLASTLLMVDYDIPGVIKGAICCERNGGVLIPPEFMPGNRLVMPHFTRRESVFLQILEESIAIQFVHNRLLSPSSCRDYEGH